MMRLLARRTGLIEVTEALIKEPSGNAQVFRLARRVLFFEAGVDSSALDCFKKTTLEHLTLEMLAYGRQKPAFSHFVARIFKKILAEQLTHFIRYQL